MFLFGRPNGAGATPAQGIALGLVAAQTTAAPQWDGVAMCLDARGVAAAVKRLRSTYSRSTGPTWPVLRQPRASPWVWWRRKRRRCPNGTAWRCVWTRGALPPRLNDSAQYVLVRQAQRGRCYASPGQRPGGGGDKNGGGAPTGRSCDAVHNGTRREFRAGLWIECRDDYRYCWGPENRCSR